MAKKKKRRTNDESIKRQDASFRKKIRSTFTSAGFLHFSTIDKHIKMGNRTVEVDAVFMYENVLLLCEDTGATTKIKDHIRKKQEAFDAINNNLAAFIDWLREAFPNNRDKFNIHHIDRYLVFNLYFSQNELPLSIEDRSRFENIIFIEPSTLDYFNRTTDCIKLSSRPEIFRFLGLSRDKVGPLKSDAALKTIKAPIISSKDSVGIYNGVRLVSFMMSADILLNTSYVMRKDNWEGSNWPYQRLIVKDKLKSIRRFLADKGQAFYNNIIVGLPNTVRFIDNSDVYVDIERIAALENCKLVIPDEWNSICIIDGQHRVYAHYVGPENDKLEHEISPLREKLHLLVTGLIFPQEMSTLEISQIQSRIFLEINSNAKNVPPDVLLHIEMINDPFSDIGLARRVIESLNKKDLFFNKFELTSTGGSKIKVASIIKYALRYLVTLTPSEEGTSMFNHWEESSKNYLLSKDEKALNEYIEFCANNLCSYFSALKKNFDSQWNDQTSKLLSVISINGFIIAYSRQLAISGLQEFDFFDKAFQNLTIDFSKKKFPYTSSQYRKFSDMIINDAFGPFVTS